MSGLLGLEGTVFDLASGWSFKPNSRPCGPALLSILPSLAAQRVDLSGDRLDMVWIDAGGDAAKMVKIQSRGDRPDRVLIGPPVSPHHSAAISAESAIAFLFASCPKPARAKVWTPRGHRAAFIDALPESLGLRAVPTAALIRALACAEAPAVGRHASTKAKVQNERAAALLARPLAGSSKLVGSHSACSFLAEGCGQELGRPVTACRAPLTIPRFWRTAHA